MTDWCRLWHEMPTDPKWRVIARKSGQPLPCVIAYYTLLLTTGSAAEDRGSIADLKDEDAAAALDMDEEAVTAMREAMEGRVIEGGRLSGWERRQPKREDNSTARVTRHRAEKRNAVERDVTQRNAPEESRGEKSSVSNDTGASLPHDPEKIMFDAGRAMLAEAGKSPAEAGRILGKWRREHGSEAVIAALGKAKREGAIEPIGFVEACLRGRRRTMAAAWESPC